MRRTLWIVLSAVLLLPSLGYSQSGARRTRSIPTESFFGEVVSVDRAKVIWKHDGETGPLPVDGKTNLHVTGHIERSALKVGSVVSVSGEMQNNKAVIDARIRLHQEPRKTAKPGPAIINVDRPRVNVTARMISLEPLIVQTLDYISFEQGGQINGNASAVARPLYDVKLSVRLLEPDAETIPHILPPSVGLIEPGDRVAVSIPKEGPKIARSVSVTKRPPQRPKPE